MKKASIFKIGLIFLIILILGMAFFVFKEKNIVPPDDISSERCNQKDLPYLNADLSVQDRVNDLMGRMNDWEKIGQMVLIEKNSIHDTNDITRYNLGGFIERRRGRAETRHSLGLASNDKQFPISGGENLLGDTSFVWN
jgi:hypothetical protein